MDELSIQAAKANAQEAGVADRASFTVVEGEALGDLGPFDAAFAFECVHDMPRPVEVLAAIRDAVRLDGLVVIMDEAVAEDFTAPGDPMEQAMYGYSTLICRPDGLSSTPWHCDAPFHTHRLRDTSRLHVGRGATYRGLCLLPFLSTTELTTQFLLQTCGLLAAAGRVSDIGRSVAAAEIDHGPIDASRCLETTGAARWCGLSRRKTAKVASRGRLCTLSRLGMAGVP